MRHAQAFHLRWRECIKYGLILAMIFIAATACSAQGTSKAQTSEVSELQQYLNNPALLAEFGRLIEKLGQNVQYPPARSTSRLLPLLPESTLTYGAFPNYGDAAHQTLMVYRQELKDSSVLRDWYQHGDVSAVGSKVEYFLDKVYELSQFLGDEIVVSASAEDKRPSVIIVAEIRKPGLKKFLQETIHELAGETRSGVDVLDAQELAATVAHDPAPDALVLVRPDFAVVAFDLATLRSFNAGLDRGAREFASTPFGQRAAQGYQGGVTTLVAADMHRILSEILRGSGPDEAAFQRSGFADMKYLVWQDGNVEGQSVSQAEITFTGPRHGLASWLAKPALLGSLDFASPKAIMVMSVALADPAQVFDDVKELSGASGAFATLGQFEQATKLSLKDDVIKRLGGEVTVEVDDIAPPMPVWKAMLQVKDPDGLQQILRTLLVMTPFTVEQSDDGGFASYTLRSPSVKTPLEISYAFADGYLIVASSHGTLAEAVRMHRSGESLAKSKRLLASLPPGHPSGVSALLFEDPTTMARLSLSRNAPQIAQYLPPAGTNPPIVMCAYGEDSAIRGATTSAGFRVGAILVVGAVAIPNLLRARIAANEASAVGSIRTVITAQVAYSATYPQKGYARDLATLGTDPRGTNTHSDAHAGFLDALLANASCTAGKWCTKSGFRFTLTAVCNQELCNEFVVTGTPVASDSGGRSFCSTSDAVIHSKTGAPLVSPVGVKECRAWPPLQ